MAKINYRTCDICGGILRADIQFCGYRIWNKLFNRLDICNKWMKKIRLLSTDKRYEQKYVDEIFKNMKKYSNYDCQSAYCEGLEDAFGVLSHRRLYGIKINKEE